MSNFHYSVAVLSEFPATTNNMLRDAIRDALVTVGWTQVGSVSGGYVLQSVVTAHGLQCWITIASNVVVEIFLSQVGGAGAGVIHYLLPAPEPYRYNIHAGIHQFFVFVPGVTAARTYCGGGTPFVPPPALPKSILIWSQGNGNSAADTTTRRSFRTTSDASDFSNAYQNTDGVVAQRWSNPAGSVGNGNQRLFVPTAVRGATQFTGAHENSGFCWGKGDPASVVGAATEREGVSIKVPPIIGWGLTGIGDYPRMKGELYDAMLETRAYPAGARCEFDGREWLCLTDMNTSAHSQGTIWLAVG